MTPPTPNDVCLSWPQQRIWALFDAGRHRSAAVKTCYSFSKILESMVRSSGSPDFVGDALGVVHEILAEQRRVQGALREVAVSAVALSVKDDQVRLHCVGDCRVHRMRQERGHVIIGPHTMSFLGWEDLDIQQKHMPAQREDVYSLVPPDIDLSVEPGDDAPTFDACVQLAQHRAHISGGDLPSGFITIRVIALPIPIPDPSDDLPPGQEAKLKAVV